MRGGIAVSTAFAAFAAAAGILIYAVDVNFTDPGRLPQVEAGVDVPDAILTGAGVDTVNMELPEGDSRPADDYDPRVTSRDG